MYLLAFCTIQTAMVKATKVHKAEVRARIARNDELIFNTKFKTEKYDTFTFTNSQ